ncbi:efflux RND transporter periplasmic adaptor subunit [Ohtaekwangia koreensis]|uniref:Membrane fusion protein, multidrug efflux system n=1 Tax=Ohtaekwangia koreensis TaxID=688867 RepID=A0A1T5MDZ6_9BACT|nr:efflux RND transporter periplasmic adaptor subunit [Ohtaekwangia koreensis]SKC86128.1 membrane fusion protein, multidrug efflux system [Ohtaekwangia koreensis]
MIKYHLHQLFATLTILSFLYGCGNPQKKQQGPPPAVPVNVLKVTSGRVTGTDVYPATVVPINEVELRPQVSGYITSIYVKDGQKVTRGQKLYEIDRSKYQAAIRQAQANVQSAKANLQRVKQDLDRYERLLEKEAIARQQVDYARADYQTAESQLASAEAQLSSASTDYNYSVITAPFDGTIGISQVRIGAQVSPGQPLLNTISSEDPMATDFVINEGELPRFNRLRSSTIDSLFTLTFSDGVRYEHPGKLMAIDRAIGRQSGTITVRLTFPNPKRELFPGMTVNVNVLNQDIGEQVVIPYKSVTEQMGEYYVYVVQGDSVQQRRLVLGTRLQQSVVVRDGLKDGETIVTEGIQRLRQGAKVQVGPPAGTPQPNAAK